MELLRYMLAKEEVRTAFAEYSAATAQLELARIRERFAEIVSQVEPLASLNPPGNLVARQKQIKAARYVVFGRKVTDNA